MENYFQWSELDEDDVVTVKKTAVKNPSNLGDAKVEPGEDTRNGTGSDEVKIKEPNHVMENEMSQQENAKIEDSIADGKESLVSSGLLAQDDVEYHIKHSKLSLAYHSSFWHTIPHAGLLAYHTIITFVMLACYSPY